MTKSLEIATHLGAIATAIEARQSLPITKSAAQRGCTLFVPSVEEHRQAAEVVRHEAVGEFLGRHHVGEVAVICKVTGRCSAAAAGPFHRLIR